METISYLKRYTYSKIEQVISYNKQKDELKIGAALIHVAYSKSYNNTQQDEIQGACFGQQSLSTMFLFPVHITVKPNKGFWRRYLSQWLVNLVTIL